MRFFDILVKYFHSLQKKMANYEPMLDILSTLLILRGEWNIVIFSRNNEVDENGVHRKIANGKLLMPPKIVSANCLS